ncbi:MAG: OmpA family protein, partial [Pseudomonadota bacterium]
KAAAEEAARLAQEAAASGDAEAAAAADEAARAAQGNAVEAAAKAAEEAATVETLVAETVPVVPIDAPVAAPTAVEALTELLTAPADSSAATAAPVIAAAEAFAAPDATLDPAATPETAPIDVLSTIITREDTRSSVQEFAAAPVALKSGKKNRLSDLEKVGLIALGALVVGAVLNDGREVVSNSGDRVVVRNPDGAYRVYKDDDTLLRRPGSTVRTETYRDGSTRTIVERDNGTQVVTIRDATGRVVRRASYDRLGREIVLIDDFVPEERVIVTDLPRPHRDPITISSRDEDARLKAALAAEEAARIGRTFSLRQIRDIPQVRALAAAIDAERITFDSGSSVIRATEARKLADLGRTMGDLLAENPAEMFLIEGHTDAVGSAASNLLLSDRRAESVALALTEYFDIPPENMVVQGYGEGELLIETQGDERLNRRVGVRLITPLMRSASLR